MTTYHCTVCGTAIEPAELLVTFRAAGEGHHTLSIPGVHCPECGHVSYDPVLLAERMYETYPDLRPEVIDISVLTPGCNVSGSSIYF